MSKSILEKIATAVSAAVIVSAVWFWILQIGDVLETLKLAYG
jgi:hypothetical protein